MIIVVEDELALEKLSFLSLEKASSSTGRGCKKVQGRRLVIYCCL